ncbi:MAG TPA: hypothetical protein VFX28_00655, partial [Methylomirabilota bacterium]|nr:hypothetical protein [Methylomirabilota bacterium]
VACGAAWMGDGAAFADRVLGVTDLATRKAAPAGGASALPPWQALRAILAATALVFAAGAAALAAVGLVRAARGTRAAAGAVVAAATLAAVLPGVAAALDLVASSRAVKPVAAEVARRVEAGDVVALEGPIENAGALEWYAGVRPVIVDGRRSVLGFGATRPESAETFWETGRLRQEWAASARIWLVTGRETGASAVASLPGARLVAAAGGRRLYVNR